MTAPTVSDSLRAAAEGMGLHPTTQQLAEADRWVASLTDQATNAGVPAYEADLLVQGFMLGKWWAEQAQS